VALIEVDADAVPLGRNQEVGRILLRFVAECRGPESGCAASILDLQHDRFCTDSHQTPPRRVVNSTVADPDVKAHAHAAEPSADLRRFTDAGGPSWCKRSTSPHQRGLK